MREVKIRRAQMITTALFGICLLSVSLVYKFLGGQSSPLRNHHKSFSSISESDFELRQDLPDHVPIPEEARISEEFYGGNHLQMVLRNSLTLKSIRSVVLSTARQEIPLAYQLGEQKNDEAVYSTQLPQEISPGEYSVRVKFEDGQTVKSEFRVMDPQRFVEIRDHLVRQRQSLTSSPEAEDKPILKHEALPRITYQGSVCRNCAYEIVFGADLKNLSNLAVIGLSNIWRSTDRGRSWSADSVNSVSNYPGASQPYSSNYYWCDPQIWPLADGTFLFAGMFNNSSSGTAVHGGGALYHGRGYGPAEKLDVTIIQGAISGPDLNGGTPFDRPVLAADLERNSVYVGANGVWFEESHVRDSGLYVSKDGGITFQKNRLKAGSPPLFLAVDSKGTPYADHIGQYLEPGVTSIELLKFISTSPLTQLKFTTPAKTMWAAKITNGSADDKKYAVWPGPILASDNSSESSFYGRLYLLWAQSKSVVPGPATSWDTVPYGKDFDILLSHSEDEGASWSHPTLVNDDTSGGDQVFPSMALDNRGGLHVVFFDHRENLSDPLLDTYYTESFDGGDTFAKNLKISESPILIDLTSPYGVRFFGDYANMVAASGNRTLAAYACTHDTGYDVCLTEISKPGVLHQRAVGH